MTWIKNRTEYRLLNLNYLVLPLQVASENPFCWLVSLVWFLIHLFNMGYLFRIMCIWYILWFGFHVFVLRYLSWLFALEENWLPKLHFFFSVLLSLNEFWFWSIYFWWCCFEKCWLVDLLVSGLCRLTQYENMITNNLKIRLFFFSGAIGWDCQRTGSIVWTSS